MTLEKQTATGRPSTCDGTAELDLDLPPVSAASAPAAGPADVSLYDGWAGHMVAVLFAAGGPVKLESVSHALGISVEQTDALWRSLCARPPLGLGVQRHGDELELVTDPLSARYVEAMLGLDRPARLSRAALETVAIVAYRQPVTRAEIEGVRGVNSDSALTTLLNRGLVSEVGRRESVGRPTLYGTTPEFLRHLGLSSLSDLPPLPA